MKIRIPTTGSMRGRCRGVGVLPVLVRDRMHHILRDNRALIGAIYENNLFFYRKYIFYRDIYIYIYIFIYITYFSFIIFFNIKSCFTEKKYFTYTTLSEISKCLTVYYT